MLFHAVIAQGQAGAAPPVVPPVVAGTEGSYRRDSQSMPRAAASRVYTKTGWGDDWELQEHLYADACVWTAAPSISSATLRWRYGWGAQYGSNTLGRIRKLSGPLRLYVKIEYPARNWLAAGAAFEESSASDPLRWYGTVEVVPDRRGGQLTIGGNWIQTGVQELACVGLEQLLNRQPLSGSTIRTERGVVEIDRLLPFNPRDELHQIIGNRSGPLWLGVPIFSNRPPWEADHAWSTRQIAQYLVRTQQPKNRQGAPRFYLLLRGDDLLPGRDAPTFDPHGMTLWESLNALIPRSRFIGWKLSVEPNVAGDVVYIRLFSLSGAPLRIEDETIAANPTQWRLRIDKDPDIEQVATLKSSSLQAVDQIVCRGAQRTATGTFSIDDGTLEPAWTTEQETEYEAGASGQAGYAALDRDEKQRRNAEARAVETVRSVYRSFRIPGDWDGQVGNGEGGAKLPLFPRDDRAGAVHPFSNRHLTILPQVLLTEGKNWAEIGDINKRELPPDLGGPIKRQRPLAWIKTPIISSLSNSDTWRAEVRWVELDQLARSAAVESLFPEDSRRWSGFLQLPQGSEGAGARVIEIDIAGESQHIWAAAAFTKLADDYPLGGFDYEKSAYTLTLAEDRYCEAAWPPDPSIGLTRDPVRRYLIDCGDSYRLDWLAKNTILRLSAAGQLVRSTDGAWIADDRAKLRKRAKLLWAYFGRDRQAITWSTRRLSSEITIGDYLVSVGQQVETEEPLGSIVTQMEISSPEGGRAPVLTYLSSYLELEAIQ